MDSEVLLKDSFAYAQGALVGKWIRWAIFVILALPFSLIQFVVDPKKISDGMKMDWDAIPWGRIVILFFLGIVLSFFISGYVVRIYRGVKPAPDFTGWTDLFIDGIKLAIVWFLWIVPFLIVLLASIVIAAAVYLSAPSAAPNSGMLLLVVLLILIALALLVTVLLLGIIGAVRFARTGSIREGIRISAIVATIRTMGWLSYILALVIFAVTASIYGIITSVLSVIPYIGWVLVLIIAPFFSIFCARNFTLVYDQGLPQPVLPEAAM
jgi:hypothetical protein